MSGLTAAWLAAFVWTLALELPVYEAILGRRLLAWWASAALVLALNAATHPALWFLFPRVTPYALYVLAGEACVVALEAALAALALRRFGTPGPALLPAAGAALAANALSTAAGLAWFAIVG